MLIVSQLVPTINGYKRLVGGEAFWAPNAVTYGYDSRAASVRLISPPSVPPAATRLEVRVPGADMNAFFALSAIFQLGMRGMEKKLALPVAPLSQLTPEDKKNGTVRFCHCQRMQLLKLLWLRMKVKMLPISLEAATQRMMQPSSIAREVLGNDFVEHFGGTREHEVKLWNEAVTSWEGEADRVFPLPGWVLIRPFQSNDTSSWHETQAQWSQVQRDVLYLYCTCFHANLFGRSHNPIVYGIGNCGFSHCMRNPLGRTACRSAGNSYGGNAGDWYICCRSRGDGIG